jgi:hypothetical protein
MQLDASLSWLALALTPGLASRPSARVPKRFGSPDGVFRASLRDLESCHLPAPVVQAIFKKESLKRAEKELAGVRKTAGCALLELDRAGVSPNTLRDLRSAGSAFMCEVTRRS